MSDWLTTILILLPVAGALAVWLLPLSSRTAGSLALLVALVEVGVWVTALQRFDFGASGAQLGHKATWSEDLNASYEVGLFGFSLWLVGLTVVVAAAAIGYAFWVGRERARAYFG